MPKTRELASIELEEHRPEGSQPGVLAAVDVQDHLDLWVEASCRVLAMVDGAGFSSRRTIQTT